MGATSASAISLVNGSLYAYGSALLSAVPKNISFTSHPEGTSGAFLGATASTMSSRHVFSLGVLDGLRFTCCFRFKLWWMTQMMGTCGKDVPPETQFLLLESRRKNTHDAAVYTIFLPILDGSFRSSLQGNENNELELCLESGDPSSQTAQVSRPLYLYCGENPFQVIAEAMRIVQEHLETFTLRINKKLPGMLDYFGWCTWDAFYTDVSAAGVKSGLESLAAGGVPARFLIIDDGWQSVAADGKTGLEVVTSGTQYASRLIDIKENQKFQNRTFTSTSLKNLIQEIKEKHQLKYVYIWHAMLGYWGGLKPGYYESTLTYPIHSPGVLENDPIFALDSLTVHGLGLPRPDTAFELYNDLHGYLSSCGVDGVKVDAQNILESLGAGHGGRVQLTRQYQQALEASVDRHFPDNGCISCMCHNTDGFYSSRKTAVARASDDFWPRDVASHTTHVASVAYNSLFMGEVMQPDWDMFQSLHPAAEYHAAARAIGGCGVYVSDKPGSHDFHLLKKLVLPDGSILRAKLPGRPTRDSLFVDPLRDGSSLLKVWNMNKHTGVLGAFNCQGAGWCKKTKASRIHNESPEAVTGLVRASDVELLHSLTGTDWNGESIIYSHRGGELFRLKHSEPLRITLKSLEYEIYTVVPLMELKQGEVFAPIGLISMFNSGAAITSVQQLTADTIRLSLRGCGEFGAYCSTSPKSCSVNSSKIEFRYDQETHLLLFQLPESRELASMVELTM